LRARRRLLLRALPSFVFLSAGKKNFYAPTVRVKSGDQPVNPSALDQFFSCPAFLSFPAFN
jgi:hypothetical protein